MVPEGPPLDSVPKTLRWLCFRVCWRSSWLMKEFRQPQKQNEGMKTQVVAFSTYVCKLQGGKLGCSHVSQMVQKFMHKKSPCQNKQISDFWGEPLHLLKELLYLK